MKRIGQLPPKKKTDAKNNNSRAANSALEQNLRAAKHGLIGVIGPNRPKLMISYSHADKVQANRVAQRL